MEQHEGWPAAGKVADVQAAAIALNSMFGEGGEVGPLGFRHDLAPLRVVTLDILTKPGRRRAARDRKLPYDKDQNGRQAHLFHFSHSVRVIPLSRWVWPVRGFSFTELCARQRLPGLESRPNTNDQRFEKE